jgi:hypothetical protein
LTTKRPPHRDGPPEAAAGGPPASTAEALARAREHGRAAAAELLGMVRSLLDAAALATSGHASDAHRALSPLARLLDGLAAELARDPGRGPAPVLEAIADALDAEIARWEARAQDDPEARAVLRAFLGVRELLWEFGVRRSGERERRAPARARAPRRGGSRVKRVRVEG